ncbi:hypothetical protein GCM10010172_18900 [Paractinoplanes ferrugineus]|uniref:Uncharacterized protein n=1 Tax=Paractinoplanes ferrugineus TaxID=113564 RepID=A0A919JGB5_9ACTN|nr:hypothetical protein [Actinoplanes ferrugineus]GIE16686.1 hypothetical protein Afe05nite_85260 [Actinoplanes ferrugineus]
MSQSPVTRTPGTADDEVQASHNRYRKSFTGPSIGTEEELQGVKVLMPPTGPTVFAVVTFQPDESHERPTDEVLVEVTKDIGEEGTTSGRYTIELRTTPTEKEDPPGWLRRVRALRAVIWRIEECGGRPLTDDWYDGFRTKVLYSEQFIEFPTSSKSVPAADRQATVGVPAAALGTGPDHRRGKLHDLLTVPWYIADFTADDQVKALPANERFAYAFVLSAVTALAGIWTEPRLADRVNHLDVKNRWVVRPRTPPIRLLEALPGEAGARVRRLIAERVCPTGPAVAGLSGSARTGLASTWDRARKHVLAGEHMGGHQPPDVTIGAAPAMLFEYRQAPDSFGEHFWEPGRTYF